MAARVVRCACTALAWALLSPAATAQDAGFDSKVSARYLILTKSFTRDPHASYRTWDYYIAPPIHYPGPAKCKGNGHYAFWLAARKAYADHVNALYGRADPHVNAFENKSVVIGDGWSNDPLLTLEDAESFIQRYIANLQKLDRETDYGGYAINQISFTFKCSSMQVAKTPAVPAGKSGGSNGSASTPNTAGIPLADDKPSPAMLEAQRVQKRRDAEIEAEKKRLGPHREAEARRLVEMREKAEQARGVPRPDSRPNPAADNKPPSAQDDAATAARKRREAQEAAQAEREKAEAEAKKKREEELRKHLAEERAGIRLRALKCGGEDTVTGVRPAVSPRIANCIAVHYEARCPGVPQGQGTRMVFNNFVGGNSCYGDTQKLNPPLACKPENAIVQVNSVKVCGW